MHERTYQPSSELSHLPWLAGGLKAAAQPVFILATVYSLMCIT